MAVHEMRPGDVRVFRKGEALVLATGIWAKREGKKWIRIDITGTGKHTTVTNNPESERFHRTLFRDLRRVLVENSCWPFGIEGAESGGVNKARKLPATTRT
jgi:hypothetical protein